MYRYYLVALFISVLAQSSILAQAQSTDSIKSDGVTPAEKGGVSVTDDDAAWTKLQVQVQSLLPVVAKTSGVSAAPSTSVADVTSTPDTATLISTADIYRDFYNKNPKSKNAPTAKLKESQALIDAEQQGDKSQHSRTEILVSSIRKDSSISAESRYVVASSWDHVPIGVPQAITTAVLQQFEKIERQLLKEFPDLPNAYEALLCLANSTTDDEAVRIANDLDNRKTPDWIRKEAQALLVRQKLVGKDLKTLLIAVAGQDPAFKSMPGKPVVIYSWVPWNSVGITQIRDLTKKLPADTVFIGVCTDINVPRGKGVFQSETLPGAGFFDDKGQDGALASAFGLTFANQMYYADAVGVIRTVSLQVGTEQKLQTLLAK